MYSIRVSTKVPAKSVALSTCYYYRTDTVDSLLQKLENKTVVGKLLKPELEDFLLKKKGTLSDGNILRVCKKSVSRNSHLYVPYVYFLTTEQARFISRKGGDAFLRKLIEANLLL
jgi:hypothetical protein